LEPDVALVSILIGATGVLSLVISKPDVLFESIEGKEEIREIEKDFTQFILKSLDNNRAEDYFYIRRVQESFNFLIKTIGLLENIIEEYEQTLLSFKRISIIFGGFLLISAALWIIINLYTPSICMFYFFFMCIITAVLSTLLAITSFKLCKIIRRYKDYKKVLKQQRINIIFKEISGGSI